MPAEPTRLPTRFERAVKQLEDAAKTMHYIADRLEAVADRFDPPKRPMLTLVQKDEPDG